MKMHVHYKFGLFLIFLLLVSSYCKASPTGSNITADLDGEYDYYDYDEEDNTTLSSSTTTTTQSPSTSTTSRIKSIEHNKISSDLDDEDLYEEDEESFEYKRNNNNDYDCPADCICADELRTIKCSNMGLTNVPKNIPKTALKIDLSHNSIEEINEDSFRNCTSVQEILLNENRLRTIDKEIFSGLKRLENLSLANNLLTEIDPDAFSKAVELNRLDLSGNKIVLPSDRSFLNLPELQELVIRNTSLTEVYDATFHNLSGLTSLKMDLNDFNKKINTRAFEPMKNLIKLKLPELEQDSIKELCNVLQKIDNISLKRFDISCFELVLGTSFNESLILVTDEPTVKPSTESVVTTTPKIKDNSQDVLVTKSPLKRKTQKQESMTITSTSKSLQETVAKFNSSSNATTTLGDDVAATEDTHKVAISQETIRYMLISIIVIASIGILIGILCRRDVGGIKTKCCRTRRPPPTDVVRPAEEIPLNKIP